MTIECENCHRQTRLWIRVSDNEDPNGQTNYPHIWCLGCVYREGTQQ